MVENAKAKDEDMLVVRDLQAKDLGERLTHEDEMAKSWNAMGTMVNARASATSEEVAYTRKVLSKEDQELEKEPQEHLHLATWIPTRCS